MNHSYLNRAVTLIFVCLAFLKVSSQIDVEILEDYDTICPGGTANLSALTSGRIILTQLSYNDDGLIIAEADIISSGGYPAISKGFVWSTSPNPNTDVFIGFSNITNPGLSFSGEINPQLSNETIFVRAFVNNGVSIFLSNELSIFVNDNPVSNVDCSSSYALNPNLTYGDIQDVEGRNYKTIKIGRAQWMAENLRTTKFQNGDPLEFAASNSEWVNQNSPTWCYPHFNPNEECQYGLYYNKYVTTDARNLCPIGWHIATADDWANLLEDIICSIELEDNPSSFPANNAAIQIVTSEVQQNATNSSGLSLKNNFYLDISGFSSNLPFYTAAWAVRSVGTGVTAKIICNNNGLYLLNQSSSNIGNIVRCVQDQDAIELPIIEEINTLSIACSLATVEIVCPAYEGPRATDRGIFWGLSPGVNMENSLGTYSAGCGYGSFSATLSSLAPNTVYYFKAYIDVEGTIVLSEESVITTTSAGCAICNPTNVFNEQREYEVISDSEGNAYKTILIGSHKWMAENLKSTEFRDGTAINQLTDVNAWNANTTPVWTYYNNDESFNCPFGKLYSWEVITSAREICPSGWHLPTLDDWNSLTNGISVTDNAPLLRSNSAGYWINEDGTSSNSTGFSAIPQGRISWLPNGAAFQNYGWEATWWVDPATTQVSGDYYKAVLYGYSTNLSLIVDNVTAGGHGIRCVSDSEFQFANISILGIQNVSTNQIDLNLDITSDGGTPITHRGIVWSTNELPTIENNEGSVDYGPGENNFVANATNLPSGTGFYFRAYVINMSGVSYSSQVFSATLFDLNLSEAINVTDQSASFTSTIISEGDGAITSFGICWSQSSMPSLQTNQGVRYTTPVSGVGYINIDNLLPNTTYFVRGFAQNSGGTVYSAQKQFSTLEAGTELYSCNPQNTFNTFIQTGSVSDIDGNIYRTVSIGNKLWMAENLRVTRFNNGDEIPQLPLNGSELTDFTPFFNPGLQYPVINGTPYCEFGNYYNGAVLFDDRNVCPTGWHVSTLSDWDLLSNTLGEPATTLNAIRSSNPIYWTNYGNYTSSNSSGLSILAAGEYNLGGFNAIGSLGIILIDNPTEPGGVTPYANFIYGDQGSYIYQTPYIEYQSASIRCVQD
jgi:uncharacterized protein (TIGR02145 family)